MKKKNIFILISIIASLMIVFGVILVFIDFDSNNTNSSKIDTNPTKSSKPMGSELPDSNYYKENKDGSMSNTSTNISKKHTSGDFVVSGMSISMPKDEDFFVDYEYTIKNNSSNDYNSFQVSIVFKFADNSELVSSAYLIDSLAAGKSIKVKRREYISVLGASDFEFLIEKVTD